MNWPYISSIVLKNWKKFDFQDNDVVIFVGSNNCWKSTTLKEIDLLYANSNSNTGNKLIDKVQISNDLDDDSMRKLIIDNSHKKVSNWEELYEWIWYSIHESNLVQSNLKNWLSRSRNYHKVFTSILDTDNRLSLLKSKKNKESWAIAPSEVYHIYSDNIKLFAKLRDLFEKVFWTKLYFYPWYHYGTLEFKVSDIELKEHLTTDPEYDESKFKYNESESIATQGDWMKSFTWIVAELISSDKNTYFIDEPESFLHPPQANILWQEIWELTKWQIFLATHSQDFIKWVLRSNSERVKIFRIVRNPNETKFTEINKNDLLSIQENPFLHYSNYLDSLFHHYTVICEHSTDCIFFNRIFDRVLIEQWKENYSINYIYTWWKNDYPKIYELSKKLWIKAVLIWDVDVLNTWSLIEKILWKTTVRPFKTNWNRLKSKVSNLWITTITWRELKEIIGKQFVDTSEISKDDVNKLRKVFSKLKKPRDQFKQKWENIYPKVPKYYIELLELLKEHGLFLVPVWEMENLIPSIKSKKKNFVNEALKIDIKSNEFDDSKKFINFIVDTL